MTVDELAKLINESAPCYKIGGLQEFRSQLHRKRARTQMIFTAATIREHYAFHDGGRTELQYNIGRESNDKDPLWRHGIAFSFERSQTLPDTSILKPKVERFNAFLRTNGSILKGLKMSCYFKDARWTGEKSLKAIPADWQQDGSFIFIGKRCRESSLLIEAILSNFDRLYPAYRYVESGKK